MLVALAGTTGPIYVILLAGIQPDKREGSDALLTLRPSQWNACILRGVLMESIDLATAPTCATRR
jgi:hypothetical protein